jgi:MSHA biogenesis protein MshI
MVRSLGVTQAHLDGEVDSVIERLTLEFQRTLDHFDRQFGGVPVDRLLLVPSEKVDGLRDGLARNLALPVEVMDLGQVLDLSAIPNVSELPTPCFHAIGAALRKEDTKP